MPVLSGLDLLWSPSLSSILTFSPLSQLRFGSLFQVSYQVSLRLFSCRGSGPESGMVTY